MEACLVNSVKKSLEAYCHPNALFLAERLCAQFPGEGSTVIFAECCLASQKPQRAYHALKGGKSKKGRYLFALASFNLGLFAEAELSLIQTGIPSESTKDSLDAPIKYLLGQICRRTNRTSAAIGHFTAALKLDPFLWSAFEQLCQLGDENAHKIYPEPPSLNSHGSASPQHFSKAPITSRSGSLKFSSATKPASAQKERTSFLSHLQMTTPPSNPVTPQSTKEDTPSDAGAGSSGVAGERGRRRFYDDGKVRKVASKLFPDPPSYQASLRRSTRLAESTSNSSLNPLSASGRAGRAGKEQSHRSKETGSSLQKSRDNLTAAQSNREEIEQAEQEGRAELLSLFRLCGNAYRNWKKMNSEEAKSALLSLPQEQLNTVWAQTLMGRILNDKGKYREAEQWLNRARLLDPTAMDGMDVLSTVLFHLKKEVALSHLAQEALALDRLAPETWIVSGNLLSLEQEHEKALSFFKRAINVDPTCVYAHTLCGHEHVCLEQYEEGMECYRTAIKLDSRHFNAWYGLGSAYLRQELAQQAEYHFQKALSLNPDSSVLRTYHAIALHASSKNREALRELAVARRADPGNPLALFQTISVLLAESRLKEALELAKELSSVASGESSVAFLLAQIYMKMNEKEQAILQLSLAQDLEPSGARANEIKTMMEQLHATE